MAEDSGIVVRALDRRARVTLATIVGALLLQVLIDALRRASLDFSLMELIAVPPVCAVRYVATLRVTPTGIDRPGVGMIWWDDIERVEVRRRLRGLLSSTRLVLRHGQRSSLFEKVPLGDLGRGWPNNDLGRAVGRYCPRLLAE
jgi:hypothetical protein